MLLLEPETEMAHGLDLTCMLKTTFVQSFILFTQIEQFHHYMEHHLPALWILSVTTLTTSGTALSLSFYYIIDNLFNNITGYSGYRL